MRAALGSAAQRQRGQGECARPPWAAVAVAFGLWLVAPLSVLAAANGPLQAHPRLTTVPLFVLDTPVSMVSQASRGQFGNGTSSTNAPNSPLHVSAVGPWMPAGLARPGLFSQPTNIRPSAQTKSFVMPVAGGRITSEFGTRRHPVRRVSHSHTGVDFAAPVGTPVRAAADGEVKFIGFQQYGYGRYIVISHRYGSETLYAHLSAVVEDLRVGDTVSTGERIGAIGRTGTATGPHLHFELRRNGNPVDPGPLLRQRAADAGGVGSDYQKTVLDVSPGAPTWVTYGRAGVLPRWNYSPL
ncbi:M23 family metallopeptidase [Pandoraea commovens]|uniref:M23 family metallopeptidase n=1 Tax=Pandoraea commovens TaxID=2508289 RepID=A0ABY5Q9I7_9BURK|nr:M23 family metallopeptidase [Pandoraea commovens]UVA77416.1 M23 family metallopeptidase [Pandoraea commovens]